MTHSASTFRTRIFMVIVFLCMVAAFGGLYSFMTRVGAARAAQHKESFYQYVLMHHLGQLTDIDDGTGFDPNSYILTVNHKIPNAQMKEYALHLMKLYVMFDKGQALTLKYQASPSQAAVPLANVVYNDDTQVVNISITDTRGNIHSSTQHVDW